MAATFSEATSCRQSSGRYQFRWWHYTHSGDRQALMRPPLGRRGSCADLVSTAYRNSDDSRTVYGLVFDLDAHRASTEWLDGEGRLDWERIKSRLAEQHMEILRHLAYAVRSTGGKGIALLLAITPLPIQESTAWNQQTALNLQSRLIAFFADLGLGADTGARGLVRDYPNFQNPERLLFENRLALRRAEQDRTPILREIHTYLNQLLLAQRREHRLYNDARAEAGVAKLFAWLVGVLDGGAGFGYRSYLGGEQAWLTAKELVALTGLSLWFIRKFLKTPPAWLKAEYVSRGEGWCLSIPLGRALQRLLPRAEMLLAASAPNTLRPTLTVGRICEPHLVGVDERNRWLTSLALTYKWHGLSLEDALAKVRLRMAHVPGYEASRNCTQVRAIVRAIFRNEQQTAGRFAGRPLPEWLVNDLFFYKSVTHRRGEAPSVGVGLLGLGVGDWQSPANSSVKVAASEAPTGAVHLDTPILKVVPNLLNELPAELGGKRKALAAVYRRQRVGIFDEGRLVACFTRRHYRAAAAIAFLARRAEYTGIALHAYTPRAEAQLAYHSTIDAAENVFSSGAVLGLPPTRAQRMAGWAATKGLMTQPLEAVDGDPPF